MSSTPLTSCRVCSMPRCTTPSRRRYAEQPEGPPNYRPTPKLPFKPCLTLPCPITSTPRRCVAGTSLLEEPLLRCCCSFGGSTGSPVRPSHRGFPTPTNSCTPLDLLSR